MSPDPKYPAPGNNAGETIYAVAIEDGKTPKDRLVDEWKSRLKLRPPKGDQGERYDKIRAAYIAMAEMVIRETPISREQSIALSNLDLALYNTIGAIARNE